MTWILIQKFLSGECSQDEKQKVVNWLGADKKNEDFMESLLKIWEVDPKDEIEVNAKSAWDSFQHKLSPESELQNREQKNQGEKVFERLHTLPSESLRYKSNRRPIALSLSAAAVIVIAILLRNYMPASVQHQDVKDKIRVQQVITERGQRTSFRLFDGTRVQLNADSKIEVVRGDAESVRSVNLQGEAYFDVAHNPDKPFIVSTGDAYTKVLGTKFGIRAYPDEEHVQVVVAEGKVALGARQEDENKKITANQMGIYTGRKGTVISKVENISQYLAWRNGYLIFNDTPMRKIVPELERWFDIEIKLSDSPIADRRFRGSFENEPLSEVLNVIALALDIRYEQKGRHILFRNK